MKKEQINRTSIYLLSKDATEKEIYTILESNIKVGDSEKQILRFLEKQGWDVGYNKFKNRYGATVPERNKEYSIYQIFIYLDEDNRLQEFTVEQLHTGI